jgi:O-methyltransferase/8-demethyl-8-(2,3-dimethoxy-alpha-L-rhamnosyl)tetracenomycin-C 4'-O-methyltransferase
MNTTAASKSGLTPIAERYLDLMEQTLTGAILEDPGWTGGLPPTLSGTYDPNARRLGHDWPSHGHTMVGLTRLRQLREAVGAVIQDGVDGDFLEAGVWRGGACIFMRAVLAAYGVTNRRVWVADSFRGLPPPTPSLYPADAGQNLHLMDILAVSLAQVQENFRKYQLLDDQVRFLEGWFKDTLPRAPIDRLAILRLDGDLYESTIQILNSLYDKVQPGGFVIVDDYAAIAACANAIHDFRAERSIDDPLVDIDGSAVFWRKAAPRAYSGIPSSS